MVASRVGAGGKVARGTGVSVGIGVGGSGVAVGIAVCVSATLVKAAAAIVPCKSIGWAVGVTTFAPHALRISVMMSSWEKFEKRFMR